MMPQQQMFTPSVLSVIVQFTVNVQWHIALGTFHSTVLHAESASRLLVQWRRSQVKSGDKY